MEKEFRQKTVNHIFHYTKTFESLVGILQEGFKPSYCEEKITDLTYLIPMVSFCNISLRDVDLYIRYGNYGIGMSIEWAIRNGISPVIYIHENSIFNNLHRNINEVLLWHMVNKQSEDAQKQFQNATDLGEKYEYKVPEDGKLTKLLSDINLLTVPALQFFKNWKIHYNLQEIITYQEREWRYVPILKQEGKKIIPSTDVNFVDFSNKDIKPKPHLPEYTLQLESIADIRYIVINTEEERSSLLVCLNQKFGDRNVLDALFNGTLLILTDQQVKNDF